MPHKLLLADDSVTIQRVVELTFSGEDVQVVAVGDGAQAIARIPIERPDVVLADIGMPKRSGYDVAAFVKGHPDLCHIPVLLLAGAFEPVDEARAEQVRCDGVLVKPFEPQEVIARVRELIDPPVVAVRQTLHEARPVVSESAGAPLDLETDRPAELSDDYFERLDAAFAARESRPPVRTAEPEVERSLPTIDDVLFGDPSFAGMDRRSPESTGAAPAASGGVALAAGPNAIADVFAALVAAEQDGGVVTPRSSAGPGTPAASEALVDEVTRRVLGRLAPEAAGAIVRQIVTEVAERLVREEIGRIRNAVDLPR